MNAANLKVLKPTRLAMMVAAGIWALSSATHAAQGVPGGPGNGGGGGNEPPVAETAASNISFPVILSDNVAPSGFPVDGAWRFATITDPLTDCVGEAGVPDGTPVSPEIPCYYGRHVSVVSETGEIVFDGDPKVWWLQKRPANFWKALTVGHNSAETKLSVSAVDIGDLLESTPSIASRQIRTEFNLLQNVAADDPDFGALVVSSWFADDGQGGQIPVAIPTPCAIPDAAGESLGCFAAVAMSGAVPGTEQTGVEAQGTDFGGGVAPWTGTRTLIDPTTVRGAVDELGGAIPIHALVYSHCARLVIQKVEGSPVWDSTTGQWTGPGVGAPVVNVAAYNGSYSSEINSGGGLVYGYNWNAKTAATGVYRLTFVLDGNDTSGPQCTTLLTTEFTPNVTKLVNLGESNKPKILYAGDSQLGDEGGLVYIDLALSTKGGGKKGGGRR